jgi:hypothetical protein
MDSQPMGRQMSPRTKKPINQGTNAKRKSPPEGKGSKFAIGRGGKQRKTGDGPIGGGGHHPKTGYGPKKLNYSLSSSQSLSSSSDGDTDTNEEGRQRTNHDFDIVIGAPPHAFPHFFSPKV